MGKYDNQMKLSVNSNSGRNLDLKCTVTKSYDINDWTLVDFDTYLKENASKLEQSSNELQELKTRHDKIIVMCDSTGDIAEFYGKEIAENVFEVEGMEEIVNSMTEDQKAQTYLRKLNGKLQTWWIKAE
jgi:peroxiredoxin family protein